MALDQQVLMLLGQITKGIDVALPLEMQFQGVIHENPVPYRLANEEVPAIARFDLLMKDSPRPAGYVFLSTGRDIIFVPGANEEFSFYQETRKSPSWHQSVSSLVKQGVEIQTQQRITVADTRISDVTTPYSEG